MDLRAAMANLARYQDPAKYADVAWKRLVQGEGLSPTEAKRAEDAARKAAEAKLDPSTPSEKPWYRPPANVTEWQILDLKDKLTVSQRPRLVVVELSDEQKAEIAAIHENSARVQAELEAQRAANPELYSNSVESNSMNRNNVAATPHPSNPFRIEVPCDYAAGDWLGSTSLASHDASNNASQSRDARPLNSFRQVLN